MKYDLILSLLTQEELHKAFQEEVVTGTLWTRPLTKEEIVLRLEWAYQVGKCHEHVLCLKALQELQESADTARNAAKEALFRYLEGLEKEG